MHDLQKFEWHGRLLKSFARRFDNRADTIIAVLQEEPEYSRNLIPRVFVFGVIWLQLTHVVLRPELAQLIRLDPSQETLRKIMKIRDGVGHVIYDNKDRTDCTLDNLREIEREPE